MSKLSAVRTGQPTQGMGTVPQQPIPQQPASHAPSTTLADGAVAVIDMPSLPPLPSRPLIPPLPPLPPSAVNPRSPHSAAAATVAAAWLALTATELEVRRHFRSIPVVSGLEMLAKMRKQCDLAAETLQSRMDESNVERCTGCGKTLEEAGKSQFIMQGSEVDSQTGVPMPYRFCSPMCVRERNREKMLPPEARNKLRFDGLEEGEVR